MRDFLGYSHSVKQAVGARLSRSPRSGAEFLVAIGDYEDPGGKISQARARQLFWRAFAHEAPTAIRELFDRDSLRLVYASDDPDSLSTLHLDPWYERYNFRDPNGDFSYRDSFDSLRGDVLSAVCAEEDWSPELLPERINGESMVIRANPLHVLNAYEDYALSGIVCIDRENRKCFVDLEDPLNFTTHDGEGVPQSADDLLELMGWNPVFETRADAKTRLIAIFGRLLDEALDMREQEARARGLVKAQTTKRSTVHFRWLVRFQCLGESYAAIARDVDKTPKTIWDGVASAAALLRATLREPLDRGGAPRKAAERPKRRTDAAL